MLHFDKVSIRRGTRVLFDSASFQIHPGHKVGITGANGCGKSSLLAAIQKQLDTDDGDISLPPDWVIAHVAQATPNSQSSAIDYVLDGDTELRELQAELSRAESSNDGHKIGETHAKLENIHAWQAQSKAGQLLHGLGFKNEQLTNPVSSFSGGWRMRLNLAQALMCRSDLLLLDEPTNHLDLDAVIWLEQWLSRYAGTLLLISHDRDFLDSVCKQIVHIEQGKATLYIGNYSAFEVQRAEQLAQQQSAYEKQQREIKHMESFVERFRAKATKAKQAQSRLKALSRLTSIAPAHVDSPFNFSFRQPEKLPRPLLKVNDASTGYKQQAIVSHISLTINPDDRIGLLGPNGAGKSTLIKLLAKQLPALTGSVESAQYLNIGYFAQHQLEQLHPEHSPLDHMIQLDKLATEQSLRDFLGSFGFVGDKALEPCAPFSGGEKARLALALLIYQKPNLLLLDEPTNHLDLEMRQALANALQEFEGAMIIVSHDRHLLRMTCDQLYLVHNNQCDVFPETLDDYPTWLAEHNTITPQEQTTSVKDNSATARKEQKRLEAEQRKKCQPIQKQIKQLDQQMDKLHQQQTLMEQKLSDPTIYQEENKEKLSTLLNDKGQIDKQIDKMEDEWMHLSEQLETLMQNNH